MLLGLLRAIAGRRELLQLRRQRQRWDADATKLAELLEFQEEMSAKLPLMQAQIANRTYQNTLMVQTLRLVGSKACKCKVLVDKLFDRLGIH